MGKMVYLMGKSSTGKDTVYKRLLEKEELKLKPEIDEAIAAKKAAEAEAEK